MKFEGVIPALVTPFSRKDESVDYKALAKITERLVQAPIGGLFVCGSTGEWYTLTDDERMKIVEKVLEVSNGRTKIMVHVGANSTRSSIALARHAEKAGAQAISALPPLGRPYPSKLIWSHFRAISESTSLPLYLYHLPQVYGDLITMDKFIEALEQIPTLRGAKFSSYRIDDLVHLKVHARGRLNILSGCAEQLLSAIVNGAEGSICTWYNLAPRLGDRIIKCVRNGQLEEARELQTLFVELGALCIANPLGYAKLWLAHLGVEVGIPRRPNVLPDESDKRRVLPKLKKLGFFNWTI